MTALLRPWGIMSHSDILNGVLKAVLYMSSGRKPQSCTFNTDIEIEDTEDVMCTCARLFLRIRWKMLEGSRRSQSQVYINASPLHRRQV
jgi:hypothetical protein